MAYLDYNASAPLRPAARDALIEALDSTGTNPSSGHARGARGRALLEEARIRIAGALDARPSEIVFTSGGTESNNLAIRGLFEARIRATPARNRVVVPGTAHHAVLDTCRAVQPDPLRRVEVPVRRCGGIDAEAFSGAVDERTALVALLLANNETGRVHELAPLAATCRSMDVPLHCDAVQAIGKMPVRLPELGCATVAFTGHKLGAPVGIGALWVRTGTTLAPLLTGGGQEHGRRPGTSPFALAWSFAAAVEEAVAELPLRMARVSAHRDRLEAALLRHRPDATVNGRSAHAAGSHPSRLPNTLSITVPGLDAPMVMLDFDRAGIQIGTGAACATGAPSHVLTAMGRSPAEAHSTLRFSLGPDTTDGDIAAAISAFCTLVPSAAEEEKH